MGSLIQPTTKPVQEQIVPLPQVCSPTTLSRSIQNMHPQKTSADGVLGRLMQNVDFATIMLNIG